MMLSLSSNIESTIGSFTIITRFQQDKDSPSDFLPQGDHSEVAGPIPLAAALFSPGDTKDPLPERHQVNSLRRTEGHSKH